jgi:hypothetical protein
MRSQAKLSELERIFQRQLGKLRYQVLLGRKEEAKGDAEARMSFAVINLLNSWSNFMRGFYMSCAFGTRTKSGIVVRPSSLFSDANTAVGYAIKAFKPYASPNTFGKWHRRDEPPWHDPNTLMKLSQPAALSFQNNSKVQAAFSLNLRVFVHLPVLRNFYAHRNQGTQQAAQLIATAYGIPSFLRPSQILFSNPMTRPQPLIFEWLDELKITADFLCD